MHMEDIYLVVGERIRAKRLRLSLTLEDFSELSGLPASFIGQIERGAKKASLRSVAALAKALGVPVGSLFDSGRGAMGKADETEQLNAMLRSNSPAEKKLLLDLLRQLSKSVKRLRRA